MVIEDHLFRGTSYHVLDQKGRIVIPKRFRSRFEQGLAMVPWAEKTIAVLPLDTYYRWEKDIMGSPIISEEGRKTRRIFLGNTYLLEMDKQGRVAIPPILRRLAGISNEIALTGAGEYLEIANREYYETTLSEEYMEYGKYLEKLGG